jgi:hypothetical protein
VLSYPQWGQFGQLIFGFSFGGQPWVYWFAELSKWITVLLTLFSGAVYLWRNRKLYLDDL